MVRIEMQTPQHFVARRSSHQSFRTFPREPCIDDLALGFAFISYAEARRAWKKFIDLSPP